eukprot:jgi/Hompol1/5552/HPOL_004572-RA
MAAITAQPQQQPTTLQGRPAYNFADENDRVMRQPTPKRLIEDTPELSALQQKQQQQRQQTIKERKKTVNIFKDWVKKKTPDPPKNIRPVFGVTVQEAVDASRIHPGYELPAIVFRCIEYLDARNAYEEEGLYRLSGSTSVIQNLKKRFDTEGDVCLAEEIDAYPDVHAICGLMKMFLRELADPILTKDLRPAFFHIVDFVDRSERIMELARLISILPLANYTLLRAIVGHLIRVVHRCEVNKMSVKNISIVFSPTLGIPAGLFTLMMAEYQTDGTCTPAEASKQPSNASATFTASKPHKLTRPSVTSTASIRCASINTTGSDIAIRFAASPSAYTRRCPGRYKIDG